MTLIPCYRSIAFLQRIAVFEVKLTLEMLTFNIGNVNFVRGTAFVLDTWKGVLLKASMFLRQKMSRPKWDSNPNLRMHVDCSNHLRYQGQTFAVPYFLTLALAI